MKEVKEELSPREGTLSSGGDVGLVTNGGEELSTFQVTASNKKKMSCGACRYKTPYLKQSKAEYKLRSHRWNCKPLKVKNENV